MKTTTVSLVAAEAHQRRVDALSADLDWHRSHVDNLHRMSIAAERRVELLLTSGAALGTAHAIRSAVADAEHLHRELTAARREHIDAFRAWEVATR